MNIICPICATSVEVSKSLVGHKGRCPNCASKFIIPENPDDPIEILERGTVPAAAPAPVAPPEASAPTAPPGDPPPVVAAAPRLITGSGAPARAPARPVVVKQSSGAFGFLFALVLAALVGVVVYVMVDKGGGAGANAVADQNPKPEKPAVERPKPRPVVPEVDPVGEEPEPEGIPVYARVIQPILDAKCTNCHGEEKRKGRLALHNFDSMSAGSGNGSILEADPDDATRIEILFRAELPEDDDEHMPPQGKPQLTAEELAILKWWIKEGAYEGIESSEAPDDLRKTIESLASL